MKVQNKGGKGNPNHSDKTGQFISEGENELNEEVTVKNDSSSDDDVGIFALDFDIDNIDSFLSSIDFMSNREKDEQANSFMSDLGEVNGVDFNYVNDLTVEEQTDWLNNSHFEYDKDKLSSLTDSERIALLRAEMVADSTNPYTQELILLEQERTKLYLNKKDELADECSLLFESADGPYINGVWFGTVRAEEFDSKNIPDENGQTAIDRKREWYQNAIEKQKDVINDPLAFIDDIEDAQYSINNFQEKLSKLNKWVEDCQKYKQLKEKIDLKYLDAIEKVEAKQSELKKLSDYYSTDEYKSKVQLAKSFIEKFVDKNAAYSQYRKDHAIWFNSNSSNENQINATKYFGPIFEKNMWSKMTSVEQNRIIDYTGGGYSKYNKPLRGLSHGGWSGFGFANAVTELTNAINKCEWEDDIWVQRGINDSQMFQLPGSTSLISLGSLSKSELQQLVGTCFKDNGFYSSGAGKGTGFSGEIILNTYCPRGTKMAYMNTKGNYAYSGENEMILQRGYSYRITKIEKSDWKIYIDCEVILGSNDNMITDLSELTKIGNKYLK